MPDDRARAMAGIVPPPPAAAALKGLCPRCGAPDLFKTGLSGGGIDFADRCGGCGLDYATFNVGDGPAAIVTLALGAIVVGLATLIHLSLGPPIWLQLVGWLPVTVVAVVGSLRIAKAALLGAEYRNRAREGRIAPPAPPP